MRKMVLVLGIVINFVYPKDCTGPEVLTAFPTAVVVFGLRSCFTLFLSSGGPSLSYEISTFLKLSPLGILFTGRVTRSSLYCDGANQQDKDMLF